jgi:hypothetical protein
MLLTHGTDADASRANKRRANLLSDGQKWRQTKQTNSEAKQTNNAVIKQTPARNRWSCDKVSEPANGVRTLAGSDPNHRRTISDG